MLRIKRNNIGSFLIILMFSLIGFLPVGALVKMMIIGLQLFVIIVKAQISFFSVFGFLVNFCILQQYMVFIGEEVYGLLNMGLVPIYFDELFFCTCCFNLILIAFLFFSKIINYEDEMISVEIQLGKNVSIVLLILAVIITILIFPSFPSLSNFTTVNRFNQGIISFTGWSIIPYFFLAAAFSNDRVKRLVILCVFFVVFWYAFHGERVEAIGFMVLMAISYYKRNKKRKTLIGIGVLGVIVVLLFIAIGIMRNDTTEVSFSKLINSVIIQPTACDVTYVFNCAVDVWYNAEHFLGETYFSYLINCIPFLSDSYSFAMRILDYHYTAGGGMFFAEPVANFGIGFSVIVSFLYLMFVLMIVKRSTKYGYLLYSTLCISVFRLAWYGLNYPIVAMLYFAPFVLLLNNTFKKRTGLYT